MDMIFYCNNFVIQLVYLYELRHLYLRLRTKIWIDIYPFSMNDLDRQFIPINIDT
jgi:hypothetical protein